MRKDGGDILWVEFKYEQLPNFYLFLWSDRPHREILKLFQGVTEETRTYGVWP